MCSNTLLLLTVQTRVYLPGFVVFRMLVAEEETGIFYTNKVPHNKSYFTSPA